jgi:hypothetical protein
VRVTARGRPTEYPTHPWSWVLQVFEDCARANPCFAPLHEFAVRLSQSRYAAGLYPVQSMHSIRLYQQDPCSDEDEMVHVVFEQGAFTVRHYPSATRPPGTGTPAVWSRHGKDGFAILEGCLRHLGWFVEYRNAEGVLEPSASPGFRAR